MNPGTRSARGRAVVTITLVGLLSACSGGAIPEPEPDEFSPLNALIAAHVSFDDLHAVGAERWAERELIIAEIDVAVAESHLAAIAELVTDD